MTSWYLYSLAALLLLGSQRFLYKVTAQRGCSSSLTTTVFMATVALLSSGVYLASGAPPTDVANLTLLAALNSGAFAVATIAHIEALRHLPAGITFPLTRLSLVLVLLYAVIFFDERLSVAQWCGLALSGAVVMLLGREVKKSGADTSHFSVRGLWCIGLCIVCGAVASISSKLAAISTDKSAFIALSYLMSTLFAGLINRYWQPSDHAPKRHHRREAVLIGIVMGLLNFFGFYAFLIALSQGPLSAIALITGMHFVIAITLSVLIYRETVSWRRGVGIVLTLVAVYLLKN